MTQVKKVVVTGDITLDWNLARSRVAQETDETRVLSDTYYMQGYCQPGGAALLGKLIKLAAGEAATVVVPDPLKKVRIPGDPPYWHSYTVCSRFPSPGDPKKQVWRVHDFLGLDRQGYDDPDNPAESLIGDDQDQGDADILVVHEANQGHANLGDKKDKNGAWIWPKSLRNPSDNTSVLLRLTRPPFDNPSKIWKHVKGFGNRLIAVVTVNDLRLGRMQISQGLSWERTIEDLVSEIDRVRDKLLQCRHFVVSLGTEGAVDFTDPGTEKRRVTLYYDPRFMEGGWRRQFRGRMFGLTQSLVAGIALQMIKSEQNIPSQGVKPGVLAGLAASRYLHENGFHPEGQRRFPKYSPFPKVLCFPFEELANKLNDHLEKAPEPFLELQVDNIKKGWRILDEHFKLPSEVMSLAKEVVQGDITDDEMCAKLKVPIERFGALKAIDRREIEGLTAVKSVMEEYVRSRGQRAPLSIAVFGKPGSGKSFAIKAVAKTLAHHRRLQELPAFNLSQFTGPESIGHALHQVRDIALSGTVPLVFWDEFDTQLGETKFGWLRYFLAPMQDGAFQAGTITHRIGQAVFVFAGGVSESLDEFKQKASSGVKGPDFVSRLKGYIDIPGLDHKENEIENGVFLRRALLLRSIMLEAAGNLVQDVEKPEEGDADAAPGAWRLRRRISVDSGVLTAFLLVQKYEYGARSMEAIVRMSALSDKRMFERSSLPAEAQLALHVNAREFLDLVRREQEARAAAAQGAVKLMEFLNVVRGQREAKQPRQSAKLTDKSTGGSTEAARAEKVAGIAGQQPGGARHT
jgi:hypothetical protein